MYRINKRAIGTILAIGMAPLHWLPVPEFVRSVILLIQVCGLGMQIGVL